MRSSSVPQPRLDLTVRPVAAPRQAASAQADLPTLPPAPIHAAFAAQARATPNALALQSRHGSVSYVRLAGLAHAIAYRLVQRGVGPGQVVAIYAERGPALVYALLGVA
ncbi:MAG TPA: AMP-binding protein, partial [Polyangiales bacterium]